MKIKNTTKKTILSHDVCLVSSLLGKARGLMFSPQKDLLFEEKEQKKLPLHMLFVFYPLDILYLDKKKQVVELKERLFPFTFYFPKNKAQYVLELKAGTIQKTKTTVTDFLAFH